MKTKNPHEAMRVFVFGPAQYSSDTNTPLNIGFEITSMEIIPKIVSGELRGLSPAYIVRKWECSICHENLEECTHEVGKQYGDLICQMIARDIEPIEISVVDVPQDPRCRIIDMLIVQDGKHPKYIWYGFRANTELDRFKNIQKAYEKGVIPERVAFFFAKYFSIDFEGKAVFS